MPESRNVVVKTDEVIIHRDMSLPVSESPPIAEVPNFDMTESPSTTDLGASAPQPKAKSGINRPVPVSTQTTKSLQKANFQILEDLNLPKSRDKMKYYDVISEPSKPKRVAYLPVPASTQTTGIIENERQDQRKEEVRATSFKMGPEMDKKISQFLKDAAEKGNRPIIHAVIHGLNNLIVPLSYKGNNVNTQDTRLRSALYLAVLRGNNQAASTLLELKAGPNLADGRGWTPLHVAAFVNNQEMALKLLKHEAVVDAQDGHFVTPLMIAAQNGALGMVQVLLRNQANPNLKDCANKTAAEHANEGKYRAIVNILNISKKSTENMPVVATGVPKCSTKEDSKWFI